MEKNMETDLERLARISGTAPVPSFGLQPLPQAMGEGGGEGDGDGDGDSGKGEPKIDDPVDPPVPLEPVKPTTHGTNPATGLPYISVEAADIKIQENIKKEIEADRELGDITKDAGSVPWYERLIRWLGRTISGIGAGTAGAGGGPIASGGAAMMASSASDELMDQIFGPIEGRAEKAAEMLQEALDEADGDKQEAAKILRERVAAEKKAIEDKKKSNGPGGKPPAGPLGSEKNEDGSAQAAPQPMGKATLAPSTVPQQTELQKFAADKAAEAERMKALVKSYNPNADLQRYTPIDVTVAKTPAEAEQIRQYNNLLAASARSQTIADEASNALRSAPGITDSWSQYYNPADYRSTAAQAQAAQAAQTTVGPAATISGDYQADLSQLAGYNSGIATSDARDNSLEAMAMSQNRALGLAPSVAELSYKQNLDALASQQAAAQATQRGPGASAGLEALSRQAASMGQGAVNQIAVAKAQEQQAAETAYAAQANQVMIEDQKKAAQEKTNELNQLVNLTQASLANAKNRLEADQFNASAVNEVNKLQATLSQQTSALNAQLSNNTNLQNASMQNQSNLANAVNALEASRYAGTQAQNVSNLQATTARGDIKNIAEWQTGANDTELSTRNQVAGGAGRLSDSQKTFEINEKNINDIRERWNINRDDAIAAAKAAEEHKVTMTVLTSLKSEIDQYRSEGKSMKEAIDEALKNKKEE
jgi:hypothetical protein